MKGRFCCFVLALQIVSWVTAAMRPFPPTDAISHPGPEDAPQSSPYTAESNKGLMGIEGMPEIVQEQNERVSKAGSSPPRCEHKCYGCTPCEAIQVPSTSRRSHLAIQYANYEPESWKCKCGPSFYGP